MVCSKCAEPIDQININVGPSGLGDNLKRFEAIEARMAAVEKHSSGIMLGEPKTLFGPRSPAHDMVVCREYWRKIYGPPVSRKAFDNLLKASKKMYWDIYDHMHYSELFKLKHELEMAIAVVEDCETPSDGD